MRRLFTCSRRTSPGPPTYAVDRNLAPVLSMSFGRCEAEERSPSFRAIAQQANAQGITWLTSSGDSGAAGCDRQGAGPQATRGMGVNFLASIPEVTGVGGSMFVEGAGAYWANINGPNSGSALSYIPEVAWNENGADGLGSSGGGASALFGKPTWQTGPGVPNDNARDVPDVALASAGHDGYIIIANGAALRVAGTSAAAPSFAGIIALLNQYLVSNGLLAEPGLGNINPTCIASPRARRTFSTTSPPAITSFRARRALRIAPRLRSDSARVPVTIWSPASGRWTPII